MFRLIIALTLFLPSGLVANTSSSGTRGGGNIFVAEFYLSARGLLNALAELKSLKVDIAKMQKQLTTLKVGSQEGPLKLNGVQVNAINYPKENRIVFDSSAWKGMDTDEQAFLVIHELLGVSQIEDSQYKLSGSLVNLIGSSTSYDNELFTSNDPCEETRTIYGLKARKLVRALAISGTKSLSLRKLTCRTSSDDLRPISDPTAVCSTTKDNEAAAEVLIEALSYIGIIGSGNMLHYTYIAENIKCSVDESGTSATCKLKGLWTWACYQNKKNK